ncbi:MAG: hypothetical protein ABW048_04215 [Sphingobium sp.]
MNPISPRQDTSPADSAGQDARAPVLDEDKAEVADSDKQTDDERKAIDLPIEENDFNAQPG